MKVVSMTNGGSTQYDSAYALRRRSTATFTTVNRMEATSPVRMGEMNQDRMMGTTPLHAKI